MKQGHLRGTRGTPVRTTPRTERRRRYVPAASLAAPRVPPLFEDPQYLAYKARRKELGI